MTGQNKPVDVSECASDTHAQTADRGNQLQLVLGSLKEELDPVRNNPPPPTVQTGPSDRSNSWKVLAILSSFLHSMRCVLQNANPISDW